MSFKIGDSVQTEFDRYCPRGKRLLTPAGMAGTVTGLRTVRRSGQRLQCANVSFGNGQVHTCLVSTLKQTNPMVYKIDPMPFNNFYIHLYGPGGKFVGSCPGHVFRLCPDTLPHWFAGNTDLLSVCTDELKERGFLPY